MPSSFTWLDHSEQDRQRVLEAVERFKETDTRDELGLGAIRDGFADLFFPGTSTIQTRARYFLFIPWMYQHLQARRISSDKVKQHARKEEIQLRDALLNSGDAEGVIGKLAGASLKRLPSNIYWRGLGEWRIRRFPGSQDEYHALFDRLDAAEGEGRDDDGEALEDSGIIAWDRYLPPAPDGFPANATFSLSREEARYIAERICLAAPTSLLAFLVRRGRAVEDVAFPWAHPLFEEFPPAIQLALHHAQLFAETMHGGALLYNLMLAEQLPEGSARDERTAYFRGLLQDWVEELGPRDQALSDWNRAEFWTLVRQHARVSGATYQFVERWVSLNPWRDLALVIDNVSARALIRNRERQLKGPRARIGNSRALELWSGASGNARLNYRWRNADRILNDLYAAEGPHARS